MRMTLQICPARLNENVKPSELAARAALASNGGQDLTDIEWERRAARLLEFVAILRVWDHQSEASKPGVNGEDSDDAIRKAA